MMNRLTIDRYEGDYAICEASDGNIHEIPSAELQEQYPEGTCIVKSNDSYVIDNEETSSKLNELTNRMNNLFE